MPCPNADPTCTNLNSVSSLFRAIPNDDSHENQFTVKIDHRINDKQNLSLYYYFNDGFDGQPFTRFQAATPNLLPGFGNNNATRSQQVNLSHTWTISSTTVNEARVTYFREAQGTFLHPQRTNLVTDSCGAAAAAVCFTGTSDTPGVIPADPRIALLRIWERTAKACRSSALVAASLSATTSRASCRRRVIPTNSATT